MTVAVLLCRLVTSQGFVCNVCFQKAKKNSMNHVVDVSAHDLQELLNSDSIDSCIDRSDETNSPMMIE